MSDWKFMNQYRHRMSIATIPDQYISDDSWGFNGLFRFPLDASIVRCIASDGLGWQHVSVSIEGDKRPPRWSVWRPTESKLPTPLSIMVGPKRISHNTA